jgi:hypothetical protein
MVRRTLEEICFDRGATGKNLKDRIIDLSGRILIPQESIEGMDELRFFGNDAAHVEAKNMKILGKKIKVAINFTKEILKAVYQYANH